MGARCDLRRCGGVRSLRCGEHRVASMRARPYRRTSPNGRRFHQLLSQREYHMFVRGASDQLQSDRKTETGNANWNAECRLTCNVEDRQELIGVLTLPLDI